MKPTLIQHIEGNTIGRFPVWLMRQAGRYLPRYREIRKEYSFWDSVTNPRIAADISMLPLEVIPVDGIIFFSDILTLPYGLGVPVTLQESVGPVLEKPLRNPSDFELFKEYQPEIHTAFVTEALRTITKEKKAETALLGFAGAPWTVCSYLIEGKANKNFPALKKWMHSDPQSLAQAMQNLANATTKYLLSQSASGAHMVQLFDTWIGEMPKTFFVEYYRPILESIFSSLKQAGLKSIYFTKNSTHLLSEMRGLSCNGFSIDCNISLKDAESALGEGYFLQGNLDPVLLLSCEEGIVRKKTRELVQEARGLKRPAIINLGHGILPGTSVENVKAFVEEARTLWV